MSEHEAQMLVDARLVKKVAGYAKFKRVDQYPHVELIRGICKFHKKTGVITKAQTKALKLFLRDFEEPS